MRVLNLVTYDEARFFKQQVATLAEQGIESTTVSVPGNPTDTDHTSESRTVFDYIRFYPRVLAASFGEYDLIHANYGLTGPAALAQPNLPVVLSLWGSDLMGKYGRLSQWCAKFADAVIVMSPEMAMELDCESTIIPHGVDLDRFEPAPQDQARERVGWRHDAHHVLFPYPKTREVKDYPRAELVVDRVRDRFPADVELHTLHGIPHRRMPDYMNAADVLLLTSRREGSPNSVKEALACNLPIVATDVGDVATRLNGVDGTRVTDSTDELVEGVLTALRRDERSNGRTRARDISLDQMGTQIAAVYRSVLDADAEAGRPATVRQ